MQPLPRPFARALDLIPFHRTMSATAPSGGRVSSLVPLGESGKIVQLDPEPTAASRWRGPILLIFRLDATVQCTR